MAANKDDSPVPNATHLRDFVASTVLDLQRAIGDIKEESEVGYTFGNAKGEYGGGLGGAINFDIAVGAEKRSAVDGKGKIGIQVIEAGVNKSAVSADTQTSRIKFTLVVDKNPSRIGRKDP